MLKKYSIENSQKIIMPIQPAAAQSKDEGWFLLWFLYKVARRGKKGSECPGKG